MEKTGRNDPCICGSGKKFKKCCESLCSKGKFKAEQITSDSGESIRKTVNLSSFFQSQLSTAWQPRVLNEPLSSSIFNADSQVALEEKVENLIS